MLEPRADSDLTVEDMRGLAAHKPWLALFMTVLLLSLAGIPPTVGFFGKFFIFSAAIKQDLVWLAVWGVIGSIISVYYYLRPVVAMYMEEPLFSRGGLELKPMSYFTVAFLALLILVFGLASEPIYQVVMESVAKVF
jgi:NADH-quinone oxidoreductase subunit N